MGIEIHNFSEIPELKLKYIDASKDIIEIVEIFNYNMGQIYRWWKNNYTSTQTNNGGSSTTPVVIHGINVMGDQGIQGENGNSIHFVNTSIIPDSVVTDETHALNDYVISNNSVFEVSLIDDVLTYVLVGSIGGEKFILPVADTINSHSVIDWSALDNSATSILSPYIKTSDKIEYYRINVGDYKKSSSINGSLTLTNILEKKNDGSPDLPTDAIGVTSRDFAQLVLQYRKGFNTDISVPIATHKFYESIANGFYYSIANGQNQFNMMTNGNVARWMIGDTSTDNLTELRSLNIRMFASHSVMFYHNSVGDNYYISKSTFSNPLPLLNIGFRVNVNSINVWDATANSYIVSQALPYDVKEIDCDNAYILANFDSTGLGIGQRKGWAICNGQNGTRNRNGRVGVAWGTLYSSMGATFGSKDAVNVAHTHTFRDGILPQRNDGSVDINYANGFEPFGSTEDGAAGDGNNTGLYYMNRTTASSGVSGTDKNMQPSIVSLFIMKLP